MAVRTPNVMTVLQRCSQIPNAINVCNWRSQKGIGQDNKVNIYAVTANGQKMLPARSAILSACELLDRSAVAKAQQQ